MPVCMYCFFVFFGGGWRGVKLIVLKCSLSVFVCSLHVPDAPCHMCLVPGHSGKSVLYFIHVSDVVCACNRCRIDEREYHFL